MTPCDPGCYPHPGPFPGPHCVEKEIEVCELQCVPTKVKAKVQRLVQVEKEITYKVAIQKPGKQDIWCNECKWVQKPCEYITYEWKCVKEPRQVVVCEPCYRDIDVEVCTYQCCPMPCSPCGTVSGCGLSCGISLCHHVCHQHCVPVKHIVKKRICEYRQVIKNTEVEVCRCVPVVHKGHRMECECHLVKKSIDVILCDYIDKKDKVKVWECVWVEEDVDSCVCKWVTVKKKVWVCDHCHHHPCTPNCSHTPHCGTGCGHHCSSGCGTGCGYAAVCGHTSTVACDSSCGHKREGLFARLFAGRKGGCSSCN